MSALLAGEKARYMAAKSDKAIRESSRVVLVPSVFIAGSSDFYGAIPETAGAVSTLRAEHSRKLSDTRPCNRIICHGIVAAAMCGLYEERRSQELRAVTAVTAENEGDRMACSVEEVLATKAARIDNISFIN